MAPVSELLLNTLKELVKTDLKEFIWYLTKNIPEGFPHIPTSQLDGADKLDTVDTLVDTYGDDDAVNITLEILRKMKQNQLAETLKREYDKNKREHITDTEQLSGRDKLKWEVQDELKSSYKKRVNKIHEGTSTEGNRIDLNNTYTELHMIEGAWGGVSTEHEVTRIQSITPATGKTIKTSNIFKPRPDQKKKMLTLGIAGVGKTFCVQKTVLDWAEGNENKHIDFLFLLPFHQMNPDKEEEDRSLIEMLHGSFPEMKPIKTLGKESNILFIFDGLDESRLPLNFKKVLRDETERASIDVLITNLIAGELLPSALIWITSRPAAANQIPRKYIDQWTEIRGFDEKQKEDYFRKRISDEDLAKRIIVHVKSSRSLHIMCHIPMFCWLIASVLERLLGGAGRGEMPKTLTEIYTDFLGSQIDKMNEVKTSTGKVILQLGQLAFRQLQKGHLIFYEEDLRKSGIDVREASVYSGLCTQIFKVEGKTSRRPVFTFVHLSIQEFLAALYVFLTFSNRNENPLDKSSHWKFWPSLRRKPLVDLHKCAVDKALQSENGHLDLFLRFLLGLSLESNQSNLRQGLLTQTGSSSQTNVETVKYIKKKIRKNPSPERCINLFHCLNELNDHSLVEEIQSYLSSGRLSETQLSPAQWSALVFVLLSSEGELDVFDLKKYSRSEEGLLRLLPVVTASKTALLNGCHLTERCCDALASALSSDSCHLRELDLSNNDLGDGGVKLLSAGLGSPHCQLQTLRLSGCGVPEEGCVSLASALRSNPSHLRELDLSYNHPGDSGLALLSAVQTDPLCKLQTLSVDHGGECRLKPGLIKYACELTLDPNTADRRLSLSEDNRKVTRGRVKQPYPDHPERFERYAQVLCREGLTGRRYWEVERSGEGVVIGVTYKGISRRGEVNDCVLGFNDKSWRLFCSYNSYSAWHNNNRTVIPVPSSGSHRVGVYLDWPAGTLSFYSVSSDTRTLLHTFHSTFTEPLYPGFGFWLGYGCSVTLCKLVSGRSH